MKTLLVNPPWSLGDKSPYSKTGAVQPPLGLAYIAAYMEERGKPVAILDAFAEHLSLPQTVERIKVEAPEIIGIPIYTTTFGSVRRLIQHIGSQLKDACIVLGGAHASIHPEECLFVAKAHYVIGGEGEESFFSLVDTLVNGGDLTSVPGLTFQSADGKIIHRPQNPQRIDLEAMPRPARHLLPMHRYRPAAGTFSRLPVATMITSRGCPFQCVFCSKSIFGDKYRYISAEKIIEEIVHLQRQYGIREVRFIDDVFTMNRERVLSFCRLYKEHGLDLTWSCSTRANLVDEKLLQHMRNNGCVSIGYGVESGDPHISAYIHKQVKLEQIKKAVAMTQTVGIETNGFYILGMLGENKKTIKATIELSHELNTDFVIYNFAIPMPGTRLYEDCKKAGRLVFDGEKLYKRTDGAHPLIRIDGVSVQDLMRLYAQAYKQYYFRWRYIRGRLARIRSWQDIQRNLKGFFQFVRWNLSAGCSR